MEDELLQRFLTQPRLLRARAERRREQKEEAMTYDDIEQPSTDA